MPASVEDFIQALDKCLPEVFAGPKLDKLTGGIFTWSSFRTRLSRGQVPRQCFGPRLSANAPTPILKEPFLIWLRQWLEEETLRASAKRPAFACKLTNPTQSSLEA
jgi:hypothetical protein